MYYGISDTDRFFPILATQDALTEDALSWILSVSFFSAMDLVGIITARAFLYH